MRFHCATFEDFPAQDASYDLVYSGTAFHWISPDVAYKKTAQLLRAGGALALFWNLMPEFEKGDEQFLRTVFDELAPHLNESTFGTLPVEAIDEGIAELSMQSEFEDFVHHRFRWDWSTTSTSFCQLLDTFANFQILEPALKEQLFARIAEYVESARSGTLVCRYTTILNMARRS